MGNGDGVSDLTMWAWKLDDRLGDDLATCQFIRYHLMRLQIGDDLTHMRRGGQNHGIASVEGIQTLRSELQPIS